MLPPQTPQTPGPEYISTAPVATPTTATAPAATPATAAVLNPLVSVVGVGVGAPVAYAVVSGTTVVTWVVLVVGAGVVLVVGAGVVLVVGAGVVLVVGAGVVTVAFGLHLA